MDSDTKKFIIFGSLSGIFGVGSYFLWKQKAYYQKQIKNIKGQKHVQSASSVMKEKERFDQPKFVILNGVCMKIRDKTDNKQKFKINRHNKLLTTELMVSLSNDRHTSFHDNKIHYPEFQLVDPLRPENAIQVKVDNQVMSQNLTQKREFWKSSYNPLNRSFEHFEKLSLVTYEGSTLTLIGMLQYDKLKDKFVLSNVVGIVAGGIRECANLMKRQFDIWNIGFKICFGLSLTFGAISAYILSTKYTDYKLRKEIEMRSLQNINLVRMPTVKYDQEGATCLICCANGSNVITVPCNHLAICEHCFNEMRIKYRNRTIAHFNCPVCRSPMEENNFILVGYKEPVGAQEQNEEQQQPDSNISKKL